MPFVPVILVTAKTDPKDIVAGLEAGGDEYLTKPMDQAAPVARVKSMLRIKNLHDTVQALADERAEWNRTLERRVEEQVGQLEQLGRLKRFFSPQLAELIVAGGADDPLKTHRREVTVVFLDLPGFTAFAETTEAEEVIGGSRRVSRRHGQADPRARGDARALHGRRHDDLLQRPRAHPESGRARATDGGDHEKLRPPSKKWRKLGFSLDLGIAQGYATIGAIGFGGRRDYGAIGTVTNLAARSCGEAAPGQILISQRVLGAAEEGVEVEPAGELTLKGFSRPVAAHNVLRLK